ncbi:hypothetical protein BCR42DRAFT_402338 [Absidia repens]|uniref:Uncharacterized protein n=1 Tax=Absidia repens TaxID=90262 RepID=A0A1X2IXV9_9FUNG|nr:hypothetical protein BCR42DRAFT_402338 [Absidia repens]
MTNRTSSPLLCIGDEILFYDESNNILVAENPLETRACTRPTQNNKLTSESLGASIFKIEPQQTHAEKRHLEHFLCDDDPESVRCEGTPEELLELDRLTQLAEKEYTQNQTERQRLLGKPVLYGQVIQLYNSHFNKYLGISGRTCENDVSNLQVNLSNELIGSFRIMPRYRIRVDGEPVRLGDTIAIQCVRPEGYLNAGLMSSHSSIYDTDYYEVYSHTRISSWTMGIHSSATAGGDQDKRKTKYINSAQYIRFYHKEMEAYLESNVLNWHKNEVQLKRHVLNPLDPKESDSPLSFWEIENVDISRGSLIRWNKSVRIRHAASRAYLYIDPNNVRIDVNSHKISFSLGLMKDPPLVNNDANDPTLFSFVPASEQESRGVPFGSYLRIQHVATRCWLHAASKTESQIPTPPSARSLTLSLAPDSLAPSTGSPAFLNTPFVSAPSSDENHQHRHHPHQRHDSIRFSSTDSYGGAAASQLEIPTTHQVTATQDFFYHDCFTVTLVSNRLTSSFNTINEFLPRLQAFLKHKRPAVPGETSAFPISQSEFSSISNILMNLIRFCTKSSEHDLTQRRGLPIPYHQALLRDNGIIETVINMIQIPFDLGKRGKFNRNRKSDQVFGGGSEEKVVDLGTLTLSSSDQHPEYRLKVVLTLCYNLLRVFLLGVSSYEENVDSKINQDYVIDVSGDSGIQLYLSHLNCGIGATSMLENLVQDNDKMVAKIVDGRPDIVETLVKHVYNQSRSVLRYIHESNNRKRDKKRQGMTRTSNNSNSSSSTSINNNMNGVNDFSPNMVEHMEFVGCLDLLGAFCSNDSASGSLTFSHRDYVLEQLFDPLLENKLVQCRLVPETGSAEINLLSNSTYFGADNDVSNEGEWMDLDMLLYQQHAGVTRFLSSVLDLVCSLSFGTNNSKSLEVIRSCINKDVCLKCLGFVNLPSEIRSRFCDLLRVLYVDVAPYSEVLLSDFTIRYDSLEDSTTYPHGGNGSIESRQPEFFDQLKRWILVFLDDHRHCFTECQGDINFLSSVLKLIHTQLKQGFFSEEEDVKRLFRALVYVLDGRIDARNAEHLKYLEDNYEPRLWAERFLLTEGNQAVMNIKIQVLEIFDLIFDLRVHVRMNMLATKWKKMETNTEIDPFMSLRNVLTTIFSETVLRQRESSLMPILKDILRYQYAPLKHVAVVVMHRMYHDCEDLFNKSAHVLILHEAQQVFVYHGIKRRLARLRSYLLTEKLGVDHFPLVDRILREFISLFHGSTIDYNDQIISLSRTDASTETSTQQTVYKKIFKNLSTHQVIIHILEALNSILPILNDSTSESFSVALIKTCLDLLVELIRDDADLQGSFLLENFDLLIDITGYHTSLSYALYGICGQNLYISIRVSEEQTKRILELSDGKEASYLRLLHDFMKPHGKLIKRNQDMIMRLIMNNRQLYVPFATIEELVHTDSLEYCLELVELLSICGHGENTFGQSFARTVFSISDISDMVQNTDTPLSLKSKALRFLASIYLDTADVSSTMLPIDENTDLKELLDIVYQDLVDAGKSQGGNEQFTRYIYEGVVVLLRSVFEYQIRPETIIDENLLDLCPLVIDATGSLLMTNNTTTSSLQRQHQKNLLACVDSMINVSGCHGSLEPKVLRSQMRQLMMQMDKNTDSMTNRPLGSINAKFQGFIRTLRAHRSVLELQDEEFKQLGSHYNLADDESEQDVKSLIDFLSMMTSNNKAHNDKNEDYQVATMKLLQEIPNRYIRQRSEENVINNPAQYEELELNKANSQNILNRLGCTLVAQNFLSSPKRHVFKAGLTLLIALLEGGNKNVQDKLEEYFYSIREERFFYSFHRRMQTDIASLKEAQQHLLRAAIKLKRQEGLLRSHDTEGPWMKQQRNRQSRQHRRTSTIFANGSSPSWNGSQGTNATRGIASSSSSYRINGYSQKATKMSSSTLGDPSDLAMNYQAISTLMTQSEMTEFGTATEDFEGMKDAMRAVQLMVEGHNMKLQTYLAKQPDNIKSFNIVQDVVEYLHAIVPLCNIQNIRLIIQVLDTITELAQGCLENQFTIFNGKIIKPMNTILRETYTNCPSSLVHELKSKVVVCLLSLLEGGIENSDTIFREMTASLDLETIVSNMEDIYNANLHYLNSPKAFTKLEGGFLYCMLVMTLYPALEDSQRTIVDGNSAFDYFQRNTGKIEVIMDYGQEKQLSRVLFPIPEICKYFREETKQRFLWNVKRDSPSTKIEDFVEQSGHMIYEIENQARVTYNEHLSLLTKYSSLWWKASFVVTILLNALMLSCSSMLHGKGDNTIYTCHSMNSLLRVLLGLGHLVLWHLSTAEFYFIQLPILVKRRSTTKLSLKGKLTEDESPSMFAGFFSEEHFQGTFVLASLMESQFIYHVVMVLLSYLGLWYPGFYAVHLLDFVFRDRILQGVIASITLNGSSISHTAMLAIVVIYLHSVIAYKYFRGDFDTSKGLYCRTLSECFVNVLSHGLRGGIGDVFTDSLSDDGMEDINKGWRIGFEMSFYLVVVVFLLNAIFGIIFDTFGHLRDERSSVQQDMKNSCFICSVPAVEFQRHAKRGFEDHVKNDHNIWQYLFFLVHLKYKDKTEFTGPESYVAGCLKDANYGFFPINRALCLHQNESNDTERLEKLEEMTHTLMDKLAKMEEQLDKISDSSRSRSNSVLLSPY